MRPTLDPRPDARPAPASPDRPDYAAAGRTWRDAAVRWGIRLAAAPALAVAASAALVAVGTHVPPTPVRADPTGRGLYYEPVTFLGSDGVRLEGWLVPAVDERMVRLAPGRATERSPGVVLVHDFAAHREQVLPWVRPLHDAGLTVLAFDSRGCGASGPAGQTFGLRERGDVRAALDVLRKRRSVDPLRLAVVGLGTGGTAALGVASDLGVVAAVAVSAPGASAEVVDLHLLPPWAARGPGSDVARRLVTRVFETLYGVDTADIARLAVSVTADARSLLSLDRRTTPQPDRVRRGVGFIEQAVAMR